MPHSELVSVVVPNYNGGRFLRECIESVLEQSYPHLEVLVMDGGSTDESLSVLESFGSRIRWVSEEDRGQADAIKKGFAQVQGELVGWLNSDDVLVPDAIARMVRAAREDPDAVLFLGHVDLIDEQGRALGTSHAREIDYEAMRSGRGKVVQPGSFYRAWAVQRAGGTDESFHLLMDVDLWIRLLRLGKSHVVDATVARFRIHEAAKSSQAPYRYYLETLKLGLKHERDRLPFAMSRRALRVLGYHAAYAVGIQGTLQRDQTAAGRRVIADIWNHPANRGRRARSVAKFAGWQLYKRTVKRPVTLRPFGNAVFRCYPNSATLPGLIYMSGRPDFSEMSFLSRYLRRGERFLDVGANEGIYSLFARDLVGDAGEVVAVEALSTTAQRFTENLQLSHANNVHVHCVAVGAERGKARFSSNRGAMNHLLPDGVEAEAAVDVEVVPLDELATGEFAAGKIDVEGAELMAFKGATRLLRLGNPPVWLLEINHTSSRFGVTPQQVEAHLREAGYTLHLYDVEQNRLYSKDEPWKVANNMIAIREDRLAAVEARLIEGATWER
ncbi:MAG: FkbM family methyltransferase [Polyangiaceae bacterium]